MQKEGIQKSKSEEDEEEGHIVVGLVGHPNVGKSSLINGLMGKKVVSASRTPGHTKHFQTIIYSEEIILCDCPGDSLTSLNCSTTKVSFSLHLIDPKHCKFFVDSFP